MDEKRTYINEAPALSAGVVHDHRANGEHLQQTELHHQPLVFSGEAVEGAQAFAGTNEPVKHELSDATGVFDVKRFQVLNPLIRVLQN